MLKDETPLTDSPDDVLAGLAKKVNPDAHAPSVEDIAAWASTREAAETWAAFLFPSDSDARELNSQQPFIPSTASDPEHMRDLVNRLHNTWGTRRTSNGRRPTPDDWQEHPMLPFVRGWIFRALPPEQRHVLTVTDRNERFHLARTPAVLDLATLSPITIKTALVPGDGDPLATPAPGSRRLTLYHRAPRPRISEQRVLFPGPRTLGGHEVGDIVISALASDPLTNDERNPLRGDMMLLASLGFALSGGALLPEAFLAILIGGRNTEANRQRAWRTALALHHYTVIVDAIGRWAALAEVGTNPRDRIISLSAPLWWDGKGAQRLSGALFRPAIFPGTGSRGTDVGYWSSLHRTLAGFEARLHYSPSAGRGKRGRTPDALRPVRRGGPGPEVFVPWRAVLTLAGEHVLPDAPSHGKAGERYRNRRDALEAADYVVPPRGGAARAGDTVEIVRIQRGAGKKPAGMVIRATARYCAVIANRGEGFTRLPVTRLLEGRKDP